MNKQSLQSATFWKAFVVTLLLTGAFFAWEIGYLTFLPSPPRPQPDILELVFTVLLTILLAGNVGLLRWHSVHGSCPIGAKRATGIAGALGAIALICPACVAVPLSIMGMSIGLAVLGPFIPLFQGVSIVLLLISGAMLWRK